MVLLLSMKTKQTEVPNPALALKWENSYRRVKWDWLLNLSRVAGHTTLCSSGSFLITLLKQKTYNYFSKKVNTSSVFRSCLKKKKIYLGKFYLKRQDQTRFQKYKKQHRHMTFISIFPFKKKCWFYRWLLESSNKSFSPAATLPPHSLQTSVVTLTTMKVHIKSQRLLSTSHSSPWTLALQTQTSGSRQLQQHAGIPGGLPTMLGSWRTCYLGERVHCWLLCTQTMRF